MLYFALSALKSSPATLFILPIYEFCIQCNILTEDGILILLLTGTSYQNTAIC